MAGSSPSPPERWSCGSAACRLERPDSGGTVVRLSGEVDLANSAELGTWLARRLVGPVVVDLTGLRFLGLSGARELARAQTALVGAGAVMRVVVPAGSVLPVVLAAAGVVEILTQVAGLG